MAFTPGPRPLSEPASGHIFPWKVGDAAMLVHGKRLES